MYIKWDNDEKSIILPVLPSQFEVTDSMNNTSVYIHNTGEINLKGKRGLYSIAIESFFPSQKYAFAKGQFHKPYDYYVKKLKKLFEDNETLHLIIEGTSISMFCTIESFTYGHADRTMDVKYNLSLKEYRDLKRISKTVKTQSHTWKKGDTWQKVTKNVLGSSSNWKKIRQNNIDVVKKAKKKNTGAKEKDALVGYKVVVKA